MIVVSHCVHVTLQEGAECYNIVPKVLDTGTAKPLNTKCRDILQGALPHHLQDPCSMLRTDSEPTPPRRLPGHQHQVSPTPGQHTVRSTSRLSSSYGQHLHPLRRIKSRLSSFYSRHLHLQGLCCAGLHHQGLEPHHHGHEVEGLQAAAPGVRGA